MKKIISVLATLMAYPMILTASPINQETKAAQFINQLYHKVSSQPKRSMTDRIKFFSAALKNKSYILGALGEGNSGEFDQYPLYRIDGFDCETYVDTVLALSFAENLQEFKKCIKNIRYKEGKVSYISRNHFASLDWNLNNQSQGYVKDITETILDQNNQPVAKIAKTEINKHAWYQFKNTDVIRIPELTQQEKMDKLKKLKKLGSSLETVTVKTPYIPLSALFGKDKKPNMHLFNQIPDGAIIEIVRPNWNLKGKIGTCLNVSHLGFAIWENGTLMYREASGPKQKTIDTPLTTYLKNTLKSPTIKGINVQTILVDKPLASGCAVGSNSLDHNS